MEIQFATPSKIHKSTTSRVPIVALVVSKVPKSTLELGSMVLLFNVPKLTIIAIQTIFADVSLTNDEKTVQ